MQANNTLTATCAAPALTASAGHSIVAIYSGDSNYNGSTSSTLTQIVNKATSTVAVASSTGNASTVNGSVTFTATVSPSNSVVALSTGTVAFLDNGVAISSCTAQPVTYGTGVATCTVTNLKAATHPITATYSGDPNFSNGTSSLISQVVSQATATTVVASSSAANTSTVDDSVTFTATVSPHSGRLWHRLGDLHGDESNSGHAPDHGSVLERSKLQYQHFGRDFANGQPGSYIGDSYNIRISFAPERFGNLYRDCESSYRRSRSAFSKHG
jgi:precorrin-6B methylase 1